MKPLLAEDVEVQTVKLVRLVTDRGGADELLDARTRLLRLARRRMPVLLIVVLPTLLAALYFLGLAAPRYQSEVKFVVRTPASSATSELTSLVQGSSISRANDDAFIAKEYILSRDAMEHLIAQDDLLGMLGKGGWDLLWRYPRFWSAPNSVSLEKQYKRIIDVAYDQSSGISTLTAQAFDPQDAQRLANSLLEVTEVFLNSLNTRAQTDAVKSAVRDVDEAKARAYTALDAMTTFRNRETVLDPTQSSTGVVQSISGLSLELSATNARLAELLTNTAQSPEVATLRTRIAALQAQVSKQRQLLGGNGESLAPRIAEYQRLLLDQQFAERTFMSSLASLESARLDATRQRIFLERVTMPDLPDAPAYPYRLTSILVTLVICIAVLRVVGAIVVDTQEHHKK